MFQDDPETPMSRVQDHDDPHNLIISRPVGVGLIGADSSISAFGA